MKIIVFALLLQPLLAFALILILRRIMATSRLIPTMVISGSVAALLVALFAFTRSTVPIAPYELSDDAWNPIYRQTLLSLYIGFGIGVNLAASIGVPIIFYKARGMQKKIRETTNGQEGPYG